MHKLQRHRRCLLQSTLLISLPSSHRNNNSNNPNNNPFTFTIQFPSGGAFTLFLPSLFLRPLQPLFCSSSRSFFVRPSNPFEICSVLSRKFDWEFIILGAVPFSRFCSVDHPFCRCRYHTPCGIRIACLLLAGVLQWQDHK
jgi:hypothetical protein